MSISKLFQLHITELNKHFNKIIKQRSKKVVISITKNLYFICFSICLCIILSVFHVLFQNYDLEIKEYKFSSMINFNTFSDNVKMKKKRIKYMLILSQGAIFPFYFMFIQDVIRLISSEYSPEKKSRDVFYNLLVGLLFEFGIILISMFLYIILFFVKVNLRDFWLFITIIEILFNGILLYIIFSYLDCLFYCDSNNCDDNFISKNNNLTSFNYSFVNENENQVVSRSRSICGLFHSFIDGLNKLKNQILTNNLLILFSSIGSIWFFLGYVYHTVLGFDYKVLLGFYIAFGIVYINYLALLNILIFRYIFMLKFQKQVLKIDEIIACTYSIIMLLWFSISYIFEILHVCNYILTDKIVFYCLFMESLLCLLLLLILNTRTKYDAETYLMSLERKRIFVRHVSHEIRTPLNTCILGIKLLKDDIFEHFNELIEISIEKDKEEYIAEKKACLNLIKDIKNSSMIAVDILNDLLLYEKLDGGIIECEFSEVPLVELVVNTMKVFRMHAQYLKVDLIFKKTNQYCIDLYCIVNIDKYKIGQVLRNLLSNALKFTPAYGKIIIWTEILNYNDSFDLQELKEDPSLINKNFCEMKSGIFNSSIAKLIKKNATQYIRVCVKDSGVGISKSNQKFLFNEIIQFNSKELQKGQGSGLGLWISDKIIRLHGGKIGVFSKGEGKGSTFYIDLPIYKMNFIDYECKDNISEISDLSDQSEFAESPDINMVERSIEFPKNQRHPDINIDYGEYRDSFVGRYQEDYKEEKESPIFDDEKDILFEKKSLVVDDSNLNRKIIKKFIEKKMSCDEAVDGMDAIKKIKDKSIDYYDVIFMDYLMPNVNGPDATKEIRKLGFKGVIIGLTGLDHDDSLLNFINSGANQIITKPINFETFWNIVRFEFNP